MPARRSTRRRTRRDLVCFSCDLEPTGEIIPKSFPGSRSSSGPLVPLGG
jgi:hypothetical protein